MIDGSPEHRRIDDMRAISGQAVDIAEPGRVGPGVDGERRAALDEEHRGKPPASERPLPQAIPGTNPRESVSEADQCRMRLVKLAHGLDVSVDIGFGLAHPRKGVSECCVVGVVRPQVDRLADPVGEFGSRAPPFANARGGPGRIEVRPRTVEEVTDFEIARIRPPRVHGLGGSLDARLRPSAVEHPR